MSGGEERRGSGEVSEEEAVEGHRLGEERRGGVAVRRVRTKAEDGWGTSKE